MKKVISIAALAMAACLTLNAQSVQDKKGWAVAPLPAVSYNSDMGFQYGICADIYNYGKGGLFPDYKDHFYAEASRYTKGQTLIHLQYDSDKLLDGIRVSGAFSYQYDPLFLFYGVNGEEAYDPVLDANKDISTARYNYQRTMFRGLLDIQGPIGMDSSFPDGKFGWLAGASFYKIDQQDYNVPGYLAETSIFHQYVSSGVIPGSQKDGGAVMEFKAGLFYDSRDFAAAPTHGIQAEAFLNGSPGILSPDSAYLKLVARWRQFVSLVSDKLVFAYHLAYQGTIAGETPFYMLPIIYNIYMRQTNNEGLGGCATVRGMLQGRLMADGYAWANLEMRWKIVSFQLLGMDIYLATNPFFDAGMITDLYRPQAVSAFYPAQPGGNIRELINCSAGLGLKLAIDQNMIISVEAAQVLGYPEYPMGMAILMNYLF